MLRREGEVTESWGIRFVDSSRTCSTMYARTGIFSNLKHISGLSLFVKIERTCRETDPDEMEIMR
jgi:hypothetical protein